MKKMIQNNAKFIVGMIVGILCCSMTIYAAYQYVASEVSYHSSDENWKVNTVEEALNELYDTKKEKVPLLVGRGNIGYSSGVTTLSAIPATQEENTDIYLSLNNNQFTVEKEGYYIIVCAIGSNMWKSASTSYSGHVQVQVNGGTVCSAGQSYDAYAINHTIIKLNVGDIIIGQYRADGGSYAKRAEYRIFSIG